MSQLDREALAGLRVLIAVAKADGVIKAEEREALASALHGVPGTFKFEDLETQAFDLNDELKQFSSDEAKDRAYKSAYALAHADGECSKQESEMLELIRSGLGIDVKQSSVMGKLFQETKDTVLLGSIKKIDDPERRSKEIRQDTYKYAVLSAVLGAFPVPGLAIATDLAVVGLQLKLVHDIGQYHGYPPDQNSARTLLVSLGLGTGARIAVSNLMKLVPGWGSVFGATTSFASTFALGKVIDRHFSKGGKTDMSELKNEFKAAQEEGKQAYETNKDAIKAKEKASAGELENLNKALKSGEITQAEYESRAAKLA